MLARSKLSPPLATLLLLLVLSFRSAHSRELTFSRETLLGLWPEALNIYPLHQNLIATSSLPYNYTATREYSPNWCPAPLLPVYRNLRNSRFRSEVEVLGCCPENYTGYTRGGVYNRIDGCCPPNTTACPLARLESPYQRMAGCANPGETCCNERICSIGEICCNFVQSLCCKKPEGYLSADTAYQATFNETCEFVVRGRLEETEIPVVIHSSKCPNTTFTNVCASNVTMLFDCPFGNSTCFNSSNPCFNLLFGYPSPCRYANFTCPAHMDCVYNALLPGNPPFDQPIFPVGCCPPGHDPCFDQDHPTVLLGCADPSLNETCCGRFRCPDQTFCCNETITLNTPLSSSSSIPFLHPDYTPTTTTNSTVYYGCCSDPGFCCSKRRTVPSSNSTAPHAEFYCGYYQNASTSDPCSLSLSHFRVGKKLLIP